MLKKMTKEEYIKWTETRSENPSGWDDSLCRSADMLIKEETLKIFTDKLKAYNLPPTLFDLMVTLVRHHFGSVEVNDALIAMNAYPEWLNRSLYD